MFDIDAGKLLIIGLVALVVIGPKDLPRVLRQVGQMVARLRKMAGEFQGQFMEAMKEADLQDLRAEVAKLKDSATLDVNFDPAHDVRTELTKAVDGSSALKAEPEPHGPLRSGAEAFSTMPAIDGLGLHLPAEVGLEPNLASAGLAPLGEIASTDGPHLGALPNPAETPDAIGEAGPGRRKVLIPRRRTGLRFEGPTGRGPGPGRPRNIRPARRETADQ